MNAATDKTYCQLENSMSGKKLDSFSETIPEGRTVCSICLGMEEHYQSPKKTAKPRAESRQSHNDFYTSWQWAKIRYEVLKAWSPVCMCCGATERIVVDHIKSRRKYPELSLEFDNLQVLCDQCNRGKSWDDETDFRPKCPEPELTGDEAAHFKALLQ